MRMKKFVGLTLSTFGLVGTAAAQTSGGSLSVAGNQASSNVHIVAHVPGSFTDIKIEQELSRPYVYMANGRRGGFDIFSIKDPNKPQLLYTWQI
jgi:hypothetical protein